MKKLLIILLAFVIVGCSSNPGETETETKEVETNNESINESEEDTEKEAGLDDLFRDNAANAEDVLVKPEDFKYEIVEIESVDEDGPTKQIIFINQSDYPTMEFVGIFTNKENGEEIIITYEPFVLPGEKSGIRSTFSANLKDVSDLEINSLSYSYLKDDELVDIHYDGKTKESIILELFDRKVTTSPLVKVEDLTFTYDKVDTNIMDDLVLSNSVMTNNSDEKISALQYIFKDKKTNEISAAIVTDPIDPKQSNIVAPEPYAPRSGDMDDFELIEIRYFTGELENGTMKAFIYSNQLGVYIEG